MRSDPTVAPALLLPPLLLPLLMMMMMVMMIPPAMSDQPLCILPVGDSITQAASPYTSWRYPLWTNLVDHYQAQGWDAAQVQFTGSMVNSYSEPPGTPHPQVRVKQPDPKSR